MSAISKSELAAPYPIDPLGDLEVFFGFETDPFADMRLARHEPGPMPAIAGMKASFLDSALYDMQAMVRQILFLFTRPLESKADIEKLDTLEPVVMSYLKDTLWKIDDMSRVQGVLRLVLPVFSEFSETQLYLLQGSGLELKLKSYYKILHDIPTVALIYKRLLELGHIDLKHLTKAPYMVSMRAIEHSMKSSDYESLLKLLPVVDSEDLVDVLSLVLQAYKHEPVKGEKLKTACLKVVQLVQKKLSLASFGTDIVNFIQTS